MKAILSFSLPEEAQEHDYALKGRDAHLVVSDLFAYLRTKQKYEDVDELSIDEIRAKLVELVQEYELKDV